MCYFIHLVITPQNKPDPAYAYAQLAAERHNLCLHEISPGSFTVTNGHCSCDFVTANALKEPVAAYLADLVQSYPVKYIQVAWLFADHMPPDADVERLTLDQFNQRNAANNLMMQVWYRLHSPDKYIKTRV